MRPFASIIAAVLLAAPAFNAANAQDEAAIRRLLTKPKTWTMYLEFTEASAPSDRATRMTWEYFEQDGKLMARQLGVLFGACDTEVVLRGDGFSYPMCPPYQQAPSLDYDPTDPKYPFKNRSPRKIWLQPNE